MVYHIMKSKPLEKVPTSKDFFSDLQNKYQYISDIEEERDKLHHENVILSKDCNELEFALEVCHQKIDCYETELQKMNEDLKLLIEEKVSITRRNTDFRGNKLSRPQVRN